MDTPAPLLAGLAGALAVAGAWEALAAVEQAAISRTAARLMAAVRAVARTGREPTAPERRRLALTGAATLLGAGWLLFGSVAGSPPRRRGRGSHDACSRRAGPAGAPTSAAPRRPPPGRWRTRSPAGTRSGAPSPPPRPAAG